MNAHSRFIRWSSYCSMKIATHLSIHTCKHRPWLWCTTSLLCNSKILTLAQRANVAKLHTDVTLLQLQSTHPLLFATTLHYGVKLHVCTNLYATLSQVLDGVWACVQNYIFMQSNTGGLWPVKYVMLLFFGYIMFLTMNYAMFLSYI